jgi:hypothetical protein
LYSVVSFTSSGSGQLAMIAWWGWTGSVTANVTEEIRKKRNSPAAGNNEPNWMEEYEPDRSNLTLDEPVQDLSHRGMTQGEQDSGTQSVSHGSSAELTGKLCQHVMALIWWKVGADKAAMEHVVQALEEWLHRRGISIYTDLL